MTTATGNGSVIVTRTGTASATASIARRKVSMDYIIM